MIKGETKTTKQEMIAGIVFTLFGLSIIFYSFTKLRFGSFSKPGSGFFPVMSGGGIALFSLLWVLGSIFKNLQDEPLYERGKRAWLTPLLGIVLIAGYVLLMKPIGYVLATLVFMVAWQLLLAREKIVKSLMIGIPATIGVYIIFVILLRVYVSKGPLGF